MEPNTEPKVTSKESLPKVTPMKGDLPNTNEIKNVMDAKINQVNNDVFYPILYYYLHSVYNEKYFNFINNPPVEVLDPTKLDPNYVH